MALYRLKSAKVTDKRVKVMNEIISGMRLIKMYAWEWAFHEYVKNIRKLVIKHSYYFIVCYQYCRKESKTVTHANLIEGLGQACYSALLIILNFVTLSTYAALGNVLTPRKVFTVIILLTVMAFYFHSSFSLGVIGLSKIWISLKRIKVSTHACVLRDAV